MSVLSIPLPQAQRQLTERTDQGQQLLLLVRKAHTSTARAQALNPEEVDALADLWERYRRWHMFNGTWINKNLGGEAASEFRRQKQYIWTRQDHWRMILDFLREMIPAEISLLESIHDRLPLWVPNPEASASGNRAARVSPNTPIFIVHGSDTLRAESVAHTVASATGRKTIILRDEPHLGRTLIEKFEQHAADVAYAVIILTADDKGARADQEDTRPRGRQNVIFEMGYFYGLIGRRNVSVLISTGVEKPSDMDGIAYINFDDDRAWRTELLRELRHAGIDVEL
jgi:predicted nucleotide-binding protein